MSKILIIEDEVAIADLEKDYLELSGFEVEIENAGDTGLLRALAQDFDLIVLDLMLPVVDGFEVCRRVRATNPHIGIIMLTARSQEMDKVTGLMTGADDYVTKPFSPAELTARIDALYRRIGGESGIDSELVNQEANSFEDSLIMKIDMERFLPLLTEKQRIILTDKLLGYRDADIARRESVSKKQVSVQKKAIRRKYDRFNSESDNERP